MSGVQIVVALFVAVWSLPLLLFVALLIAHVRADRRERSDVASWRVGP